MYTFSYRIIATLVLITQLASLTSVSAEAESSSGEMVISEPTVIAESVTNNGTGVTTLGDAPIEALPEMIPSETTT